MFLRRITASTCIILYLKFKCQNQVSPKYLYHIKNDSYKNFQATKHEGNRTPGFQNRNLMLYPLSYMLWELAKLFL